MATDEEKLKAYNKRLSELYDEKENLTFKAEKLKEKLEKKKAKKNLTKRELAKFNSLCNGKKYTFTVKTSVSVTGLTENYKPEKVIVSLFWENGLDATYDATLNGVYCDDVFESELFDKLKKDFDKKIQDFDTKMTEKYGDDWSDMVNI